MTTDSARVYKLFKSHIKDILKRLNALEEAEKARLDAEHEELQQDEYDDDDDYYEDEYDSDDDDDDEPSGECEHCQGTGFAKDDNNNDDDDDESDKHCPSCTCNEPDK